MSRELPGTESMTDADGGRRTLDDAIAHALDTLLAALQLEPVGDDRFRCGADLSRFSNVFGGQLLAQALLASSATVTGKAPHSLHAYFVEGGRPGEELEVVVDRVRDGRSFSTRRVSVVQGDRELLCAIASFHDNGDGPELSEPAPAVPPPTQLPLLQDWAADAPPPLEEMGRGWIKRPPPLEMRLVEAPTFLGGQPAEGPRSHWMRLPHPVGDDPVLHAALLTYASDFLLLDMAFRSQSGVELPSGIQGVSLDHAVWLHRPVRFDQWHLYTQETVALSGHRGLVRGSIHDTDGHLVASVAQDTLVRPRR